MKENETYLSPIRKKFRDRDGLPQSNPTLNYSEMATDLRVNPRNAVKYRNLFRKIFEPFAETKGELIISGDGTESHFECEGKQFTDFGVVVLGVIQIHHRDGNSESIIELLILSKSPPPKIVQVEARKLGAIQWLDSLGVGYIFERRSIDQLKILILLMTKYAPIQNEYLYSGWMLDGSNTYIMDGRLLQGENWNAVRAKSSCEHTLQMLEVAPHSLTIPLLAIEMLSLVHSRMMDEGVFFKGVCCLVAPTQSFKTTVASLFFDYKQGTEADVNFEATMAAIIRTIGSIRDSTVIVDDYKPGATKAESNDMVQKLGKIVRMCSDNSGGVKKAGKNNLTISDTANCIVVVTAEQMQLKVQSTLARLLILEMNRKSIDTEKLTWLQTNHANYRTFIENYIMRISRQGVEKYCKNLVQKFTTKRNTLRKELNTKDIVVDNRSNDMVVWLYISFAEFLTYAFEVKAINQEEFDRYSKESGEVFLSILEKQAERVAELDDTKRFFGALQILLETKQESIGKLQARNTSYATADSKAAIGFSKKGYVYLKNEVAFQAVVSHYHRIGKEFIASESVLRKNLADNGYILPKTEKSYIHRLNINHETYQCIQFQETKFYELLTGGKGNGAEGNIEVPDNWGVHRNADNILGGRN